MRIALDAMGSDRAPAVEVEGAIGALRLLDPSIQLVLVGDRDCVEAELDRYSDVERDRIELIHAPDRIVMGESPAQAIRRKPNSSIVLGLTLQKRGEVDAFISAGSTGAVMAGSLVILGALPGVDRPGIGTLLPTARGPVLLLDAGANVDTRPRQLHQFAHLGTIYARDLMGRERPRVGLLNIGEEPEKGDERSIETHRLLAASPSLNFIGNIEGRDVVRGEFDVLICDGFVGNVLLKFYESLASYITGLVRDEAAAANVTMDFDRIFQGLDYTEYGGAPLLGVAGVTIVCHGGSPPSALSSAIRVGAQAVESQMVTHIQKRLAKLAESEVSDGE